MGPVPPKDPDAVPAEISASRACARRFLMSDPNRIPVVRGDPRASPADERLRLHRLQARQPDAPRRQAHAHRRGRRRSRRTSIICRCTRRSSRRSSTPSSSTSPRSSAIRTSGTLDAEVPAGAHRDRPLRRPFASGAPGAPPARRPTPRDAAGGAAGPRRSSRSGSKIYATDVDNEALTQARQAVYPTRQMADVPAAAAREVFRLRTRRCDAEPGAAAVGHLRAPSISSRTRRSRGSTSCSAATRSCTSTPKRSRASCSRFAFSLNPNGFLLLGRAEMLFSHLDDVRARWT